jgi:predicted dienelactone hydrolase
MKRIALLLLTLLALTLTLAITSCGGGSSPIVIKAQIGISVSAGSNSVTAQGNTSVTAMLTGDTLSQGVTWSVSCSALQCGSVSPASTTNGVSAVYTAPNAPPAADLNVTIKATAVANGSRSATVTVTVLAVTVSITPTTASVQAGNTLQISAAANNDPAGQGVSWSISPASGGGALSNQTNTDVTYSAPASAPASSLTVTVTATSLADSTKIATATITVPFVTISVSPATANVDAGSSVPNIIATVTNDPNHKGVTWAVSCATAPCGGVSPASTASGAATVYTAPPTPPPADLTVNVTATSVADPAAQTSMVVTVKAISVTVTVTPPVSQVLYGGTVPNIVAVVNDDPAHQGVTWSLQPCGVTQCGSISPNATSSGGAITYTAPTTPPASDLTVTIVASSVSDPNQQGSVSITVPAITVSLKPASAIIPVGATAQLNATPFTPTVTNDSSNQGVTWTLLQTTACSPSCGTLTPSTTASGTPSVYAAPATVPATPTVTVSATSVADPTKSASVSLMLTNGTVKFVPGQLAFGKLKISSTNPHPHKTLPVTLTNTGAATLNITAQSTSNGAYSVTGPCQGSVVTAVNSGNSCSIDVTFAPPRTGSFIASLSITDDDTTSPQVVPLGGSACSGRTCFGGAAINAALAKNRVVSAPAPSGPYEVGTRVMDLVDANRADPYLANGAKRELLVRFWYPAASVPACAPAQYTSAGVWNYQARIAKVAPFEVRTNSCQDASIQPGSHPVVVFTHGYTGTFTDYTFLFEDLASRGYVVASVNHTFEATASEFPGGRIAKSMVGTHLALSAQLDERSTSFAVAARLADLHFVVNELERLNNGSRTPFSGTLDLSRLAIAGHSLGGMTALLGLEIEPRFRAALTLDGVLPGPLFGRTTKPVLLMLSGRDTWDHDTCQLWGKLAGPRFEMNLKGSDHLTPSDAVWLAKDAVPTGSVGMEKTVESIRNYVAAFLDANLKGGPTDELLKGASPEYPDVEVTTESETPCSIQ